MVLSQISAVNFFVLRSGVL